MDTRRQRWKRSRTRPPSRRPRSTSPTAERPASFGPSASEPWPEPARTPAEERSNGLRAGSDPVDVLEGWGRLTAEVSPRISPLLLLLETAAQTDPEAADLRDDLDRQRLTRMADNARYLADAGHLRAGVSTKDARDVMWVCTSPGALRPAHTAPTLDDREVQPFHRRHAEERVAVTSVVGRRMAFPTLVLPTGTRPLHPVATSRDWRRMRRRYRNPAKVRTPLSPSTGCR